MLYAIATLLLFYIQQPHDTNTCRMHWRAYFLGSMDCDLLDHYHGCTFHAQTKEAKAQQHSFYS